MIQGQFPVWLLTLLVGVLLSAIMFFTTKNDRPPPYHSVSPPPFTETLTTPTDPLLVRAGLATEALRG